MEIDPRIKVGIIVGIILILSWFGLRSFKPAPKLLKDDSATLNEIKINMDESSDVIGNLVILDNIQFDLDSYEPVDEFEETMLKSLKRTRNTLIATARYNKRTDDYVSDRRSTAGKMFSKAMFYKKKGDYEKAIRMLVKASKEDIKTDWFRAEIFKQLAQLYSEVGVEKQRLKALIRYYELQEKNSKDSFKKKEYKLKKLKLEQQMLAIHN